MAREIVEDFAELRSFLTTYSLGEHLSDAQFVGLLSLLHKRYFALLTANSELSHLEVRPRAQGPDAGLANATFDLRLTEAASDVGSAFFIWVHGAYKPARLM